MPVRSTLPAIVLLTITSIACAPTIEPPGVQNRLAHVSNGFICNYSTIEPEFPEGLRALSEYVRKNLTYPEAARKAGVMGRVYTSFIIETDGRTTNAQILKGIGFGCDAEALRIIHAMPRWIPGTQSGQLVRVKFQLPFQFGPDMDKH